MSRCAVPTQPHATIAGLSESEKARKRPRKIEDAAPEPAEGAVVVRSTVEPGELVVLDAQVVARAADLARRAAALVPRDDESFVAADALNSDCRALSRKIEEERKRVKAPFLEVERAIDAAAKGAREPLEKATRKLSARLVAYQHERAEKERARRVEAAPAEAVLLPPEEDAPKVASVSERTRYRVEVVDLEKVPAKIGQVRLWTLNEGLVLQLLRDGYEIPGCRLVEEKVYATKPGAGR